MEMCDGVGAYPTVVHSLSNPQNHALKLNQPIRHVPSSTNTDVWQCGYLLYCCPQFVDSAGLTLKQETN